jgi:signal transduction histidine kinase/putative methionine-R-sulfoxide reductase with GAF domain
MAQDLPPTSATADADPPAGSGEPKLADLKAKLRHEQKKLALVQDIGRAMSSALELDQLLNLIMEKITILMEADRSTLYLLSDDGTELWSKVLQGENILEIRLKVGEGISGWVAQSGEVVNIPDAYIDQRFQPAVDLQSGYRTRSILCTPLRNSLGAIVGVMQVLNKTGGPFTSDDEELLNALCGQAAMSIENSKLYQSVVAKNVELLEAQEDLQQKTYELNILFEIEKEVSAALNLDELLDRILHQAMAMVGAGSGSIALRDAGSNNLRFRTTAGPLAERMRHRTIPLGEGVIGWVAARNQPLIVNEPRTDDRHAADLAQSLGLQPSNLICAPLVTDEVLGAIELIDKNATRDTGADSGFSDRDLKLLTLIAGQASKAIQLARSHEDEANQERLASIGRMLAGVLHDLKTPMTIISGYAQLMAQIEESEQREAYVEQILRQFDLMSGMTREVLAFARGETDVFIRKVYLHKFLDEVVTQLNHALAGRNVKLEVAADYNGTAYFDEQKILRLIHNLARNAAEAMGEPGGTLIVRTSVDGKDLVLHVTDDGPGIPREMEGRLFELFSTGRRGGTGLGLAIVKKIVDEHEGAISYESTPGEGTSFRISLPRKRPHGVSDKTGENPILPA